MDKKAKRKQAEAVSLESEQWFRTIFDSMNDAISIHDMDSGEILDVNSIMCAMFGYTREEALRLKIKDLSSGEPPYTQRDALTWIKKAVAEGPQLFEWKAKDKGRRLFWIEVNMRQATIRGQNRLLVVARDISERKQIEEAIKEEQQRTHMILETVAIPLLIARLADSRILYANPAFAQVGRIALDKLIGTNTSSYFIDPADKETIVAALKREGFINGFEARFRRGDGSVFWAYVSSRLLNYQNETCVFTSFIDISERKRIEEAIKEEQQRTQKILERITVPTVISRLSDSEILYANPAAAQIGRVSLNELIGSHTVDYFIDTADRDKFVAILQQQGQVSDFEVQLRSGDGGLYWVLLSSCIIEYRNETHVLSSFVDITTRKQAEQALQESEEKYSAVVQQAKDGVILIQGKVLLFVNKTMADMVGYSPIEMESTPFISYVAPESRATVATRVKARLAGEDVPQVYEAKLLRKDGAVIDVELSASIIQYRGKPTDVGIIRDITERKRIETAIKEEKQRTQMILEMITVPTIIARLSDSKVVYANPAAALVGRIALDELLGGRTVDSLMNRADKDKIIEAIQHQGFVKDFELQLQRSDGVPYWALLSACLINYQSETCVLSSYVDITERKRAEEEKVKLEAQLLQAQKMESVGRMAGGVAHDFNNMLSVILGYTELMKPYVSGDTPAVKYLEEIEAAGLHSRDITRQLLAFSRRQIIAPKPVNLNDLIASTQQTLARLIGEDIDLCFYPDQDLWKTKIDPSQIDQILVNLAVNSRDAMPDGGKLTIETANVSLDEAYCLEHLEFTPGQYVLLEVSDSGMGMGKEAISHIFEPFFTTKTQGKGTGLGLATVYGIVKQNNGQIQFYSEPEQGTTFKIYLPRFMGEDETTEKSQETPIAFGVGTVLLVEDDDMVRKMTTAMLKKIGYTVLVAKAPSVALSLVAENDTPIDLLITDVVMPEMNGPALREKIRTIRPNIQALFMSGYTSNIIVHRGVLEEGVHFIQKPFTLKDLAEKVRHAIGER